MDMQMPAPGPQHQALAQLAGEWIGDETLPPSPFNPETQQRSGHLSSRVLDGFFVISDYVQKMNGEVVFRGHGVYSWDPQEEAYKMHWFDSMGGAGQIATGQLEGNVLTFLNTSPMGHHRYRYTFVDGNNTTFEMAMSSDGNEWQIFMEGNYRQA